VIISIMAGAIMGGIYNIYGAIIGGLFVALAQDLLKSFFYMLFGLSIENWGGLLPIAFLLIAMMLFPNGLLGPSGINITELKNSLNRLRDRIGLF
jgi:branched-subunit amino acid ABC-type transport system permease component